jgi:hypothetical protein
MVLVVSGVRIDERNAVVHDAVRVTLRHHIPIRSPAITDERSAGFNPSTDNVRQCVGGSVRYGNKKCSTEPAFHSSKHALTLNRVSPMVLSPTELALVDLNGLVRTADLHRTALQLYQQCLSAEHIPVRNSVITEVMLVLDLVGRFEALDVVRKVQNLLEGAVTLLEP